MFEMQRSFYDPLHDHGYWSPSTSLANFCEEDYVTSHYIAEFINTISNLAYIYYAIRPSTIEIDSNHWLSNARRHLSGTERESQATQVIWDTHTFALIAVGLSSAIFHMSLRALPQWLDETSMYLLAASFSFAVFTTKYVHKPPPPVSKTPTSDLDNQRTEKEQQDSDDKPDETISEDERPSTSTATTTLSIRRTHQVRYASLITLALVLPSTLSQMTSNLSIHSITFAVLLILSGLKLIMLLLTFDRPTRSQTQSSQSTNLPFLKRHISPNQHTLLSSLLKSITLVLLAFTLWLLECNPSTCHTLRHLRAALSTRYRLLLWPLSPLTQFHGWWHVLTARAAAEYISLVRTLTTPTPRSRPVSGDGDGDSRTSSPMPLTKMGVR